MEYLPDEPTRLEGLLIVVAVGVAVDREGAALGTTAKAREGHARDSNIITQTKLRLKRTIVTLYYIG